MNMVDAMMIGRNQIYCEPYDVFDPSHPLRGKKRFNENYRPIRSKINLKIAADAVIESPKKRNQITVQQKIIDDFETAYAENCNQENMRKKHRSLNQDSPFHPNNVPPDQYIVPETILEKPGKLNLNASTTKKIPFSGKAGILGNRIIENPRMANHVTSIDLDEGQYGFLSPKADLRKAPITGKLTLDNFARVSGTDYK